MRPDEIAAKYFSWPDSRERLAADIVAAIKMERDACAKALEDSLLPKPVSDAAAALIRARSTDTTTPASPAHRIDAPGPPPRADPPD